MRKQPLETSLEEVAQYARRMYEERLILDYEGNLSLRLSQRKLIAITPSQHPKSQLTWEQILLIDYDGRVFRGVGKPTIETRMHLAIYAARGDVNAIVHTHSTYASAFAASRKQLPIFLDEQVFFLGGAVECAEYAPSGSSQLANSAVKSLRDRNAVLLANHGALSCGGTLQEAFRNALLLEHTAQVYFLAVQIGGPVTIPKKDVVGSH